MGDISIKGRSPLVKGGRVGFATGDKVLGVPPKKVGVKEVELVLIANNLIMELVNDDHT